MGNTRNFVLKYLEGADTNLPEPNADGTLQLVLLIIEVKEKEIIVNDLCAMVGFKDLTQVKEMLKGMAEKRANVTEQWWMATRCQAWPTWSIVQYDLIDTSKKVN